METITGALLAIIESKDAGQKESWRRKGAEFFRNRKSEPMEALMKTRNALRRAMAAEHRLEAQGTRMDMRDWVV